MQISLAKNERHKSTSYATPVYVYNFSSQKQRRIPIGKLYTPPLKADSSSTSLTCMHVWPSMMHIATTLLRQCYAPKGHALYRMHASYAYRHTSCRSWVINTHGHAHSFKISTFLTFCNVLYTLLFTHCESEYQHVMEL